MKKIVLLGAVALSLAAMTACGDKAPRTTFKITGEIPGLEDGTVVNLRGNEGNFKDSVASATVTGGKFVLEGSVDHPVICEISFDVTGGEGVNKGVSMMVENTDMTVGAAHIDSVPPTFYFGADGKRQERNVTVTGGEAQRQYAEYQSAMYPYEIAARQAHYNLYWADDSRKLDEAEEAARKKAFDDASAAESEALFKFINEHPEYYISAFYWTYELDKPFMYSAEEIDGIMERVGQCPDSVRVARLNKIADRNRNYLRGADAAEVEMVTPDGKEVKLSDILSDDKYTMVDFWASWCGPCRASIPHVVELNKEYGDVMQVLSVSVDADNDAWQKAMKQEKMTWKQFCVPEDKVNAVRDGYMLSSIPYIIIINPEKKIVFAGHDPAEVSAFLAKELK